MIDTASYTQEAKSVGYVFELDPEKKMPTKFSFKDKVDSDSSLQLPTGRVFLPQSKTQHGYVECNGTSSSLIAHQPIPLSTFDSERASLAVTGRNLRNTPARRAANISRIIPATNRDSLDEGSDVTHVDTPFDIATIGHPGKTPKRLLNIPMHLNDTPITDQFTPQRIQSTAHFKSKIEEEETKFIHLNNSWNTVLAHNDLTEEGE